MSVEITELVNGVIGKADGSGLRFDVSDSGTTTVLRGITVRRDSSGTPAAGIGTGIEFEVETATTPNREIGAAIDCVSTDVTATSEDFDLVGRTMRAGTLEESFRVTHGAAANSHSFLVKANGTSVVGYGFDIEPTTGIGRDGSVGGLNLTQGGTPVANITSSPASFRLKSDIHLGWSATAITQPTDTGLARNADGVIRATDGSTGIRGFLGGGAAVASATALPLPTGRVFHVTGTTTVTSITSTNFQSGACITIIFDDVLTFTDGSNLKLAGNFVTSADATISLCYDGTNWFETSRSVN